MSKNPPNSNTSPEHVNETAEAFTCPSHTEARERLKALAEATIDQFVSHMRMVTQERGAWILEHQSDLRTLLDTPTQGEEVYRGYRITYEPPPIPARNCDWQFVHLQYDGPEDRRSGHADSLEGARGEIDHLVDGE